MDGRLALRAELLAGAARGRCRRSPPRTDSPDAGRQRVVCVHEPARQRETGLWPIGPALSEYGGDAFADLVAEHQVVAADLDVGPAALVTGQVTQDGNGGRGDLGELLLERDELDAIRSQLGRDVVGVVIGNQVARAWRVSAATASAARTSSGSFGPPSGFFADVADRRNLPSTFWGYCDVCSNVKVSVSAPSLSRGVSSAKTAV